MEKRQEIKVDGRVICSKEKTDDGKTVYWDVCGHPSRIGVITDEIDSYVNCAMEGFETLEELILSTPDYQAWVFLLRIVRRDVKRRFDQLLATLYETVGPLYCISEENKFKEYPLIDVVHKRDLEHIQE